MWVVKSALTIQTARVAKYLREGFEPFAVVFTGQYTSISKGSKPLLRMYLRKNNVKSESKAKPAPPIDFTDLINQLKNLPTEISKEIKQALKSELVGERVMLVESKTHMQLNPPNLKDNELGKKLEEEKTIVEEIQSESNNTSKVPEGDSFRVVAEIPDEVKQNIKTRTVTQSEAIELLKQKHKDDSGITIIPADEKGNIRVMVGSMYYIVFPDGSYNGPIDSGAKTSSLTV